MSHEKKFLEKGKGEKIMKQNKKKKNVVIRAVLLLVLVAVIITGCIFSHFGGFGTGPFGNISFFVRPSK